MSNPLWLNVSTQLSKDVNASTLSLRLRHLFVHLLRPSLVDSSFSWQDRRLACLLVNLPGRGVRGWRGDPMLTSGLSFFSFFAFSWPMAWRRKEVESQVNICSLVSFPFITLFFIGMLAGGLMVVSPLQRYETTHQIHSEEKDESGKGLET